VYFKERRKTSMERGCKGGEGRKKKKREEAEKEEGEGYSTFHRG